MHSHTKFEQAKRENEHVLILVVMEDALAPIKKKRKKEIYKVLILVVMEDALAPRTGN